MEETSKIEAKCFVHINDSQQKKKKKTRKDFVLNWTVMLDRLNEKQS